MEKMTPINLCCGLSKTIPLAFDESLSFLELLYAMNNKLTEAINNLNIIIDEYSEIETNFENVYNELNNLKIYIDEKIGETEQRLSNELNHNLNLAVNGLRATIENNYSELDTKIDNAVIGQVEVYNPTNGQVENIDKVINDVYNANRLYAITCEGYDNLELTASEYDSYNLTAYDFDNYSLVLLS